MMSITYKQAVSAPMITKEEELEALQKWQEHGDQKGLESLVISHARLAYSTAYKYANNPDHVEDLAIEGITGLIKAAEKFDASKGTRFSTYARFWIMTKITQALPQVAGVIDVPSRTFIDARMGRLEGPDKDKAHMAVYGGINLDAPIGDEEGMTAMDMLECPRMNPEQAVSASSDADYRQELLITAMQDLSSREREVITRRKLKATPETLEEISQDLGVTRERVRQLESRAMGKLRRSMTNAGFLPSMLRD